VTTRRAAIARRLFRLACIVWVALVPIGQLLRLPYLRPPWREASWELSAGALTAVWVAVAAWSGVIALGYRGIGNRTVSQSEAPSAFWCHLAIGAFFGLALLGLGGIRLLHHA
jgi:hypothetical protein